MQQAKTPPRASFAYPLGQPVRAAAKFPARPEFYPVQVLYCQITKCHACKSSFLKRTETSGASSKILVELLYLQFIKFSSY